MAKNSNDFYLKLYGKYLGSGMKLPRFCDTRKPKLSYAMVRQAFLRLKNSGKLCDENKTVAKKPAKKKLKIVVNNKTTSKKKATKLQDPSTVDVAKIVRKKAKHLTHRRQKLIEQELSGQGKTNAEMAKAAGYTAKNLSDAFFKARQGQDYQEVLAKSKAEVRAKVGIPGEQYLIRLSEIGFSSLADIATLENGVIKLRKDVTFENGGAYAIREVVIKNSKTQSGENTEIRNEIKIGTSDNIRALTEAIKFGGYFDDSVFNSIVSGNEEIIGFWKQFKNQEISANDLSMELSMRGCFVPPSVQLQAKAELASLSKAVDDDIANINMMDSYDEMLEDEAIEKKKREVEAERRRELAIREKELKILNDREDREAQIYADHDKDPDNI